MGQTRPDGCATVSLANHGNESTLSDLKTLYGLMEHFQRTSQDGLVFKGIPITKETILVTYGDCSWANAQDYKSQEGLLVCLTTPGALQGPTDAVMIDWKSTRTPRVVRSTMAGEAYAADDAIDRAMGSDRRHACRRSYQNRGLATSPVPGLDQEPNDPTPIRGVSVLDLI